MSTTQQQGPAKTIEQELKNRETEEVQKGKDEFEKKYAHLGSFLGKEDLEALKSKFGTIYSKSKESEKGGDTLIKETITEFVKTRPALDEKQKGELQEKLVKALGIDSKEASVDDIPELVNLKRLIDEGYIDGNTFNFEQFKQSLAGKPLDDAGKMIKEAIEKHSVDKEQGQKVVNSLYGGEKIEDTDYTKSEFFQDIAKNSPEKLGMKDPSDFNLFLANRYIKIEKKDGSENKARDMSDMMERSIKDFSEECSDDFRKKHSATITAIKTEKDFEKKYALFKKLYTERQSQNGFQAKSGHKKIESGDTISTRERIQGLLSKSKFYGTDGNEAKKRVPKLVETIEKAEDILPNLSGEKKMALETIIKQAQDALKSPTVEKIEGSIAALEGKVNEGTDTQRA